MEATVADVQIHATLKENRSLEEGKKALKHEAGVLLTFIDKK